MSNVDIAHNAVHELEAHPFDDEVSSILFWS